MYKADKQLTLITLLILISHCNLACGQHQRLGLPAQEILFGRTAKSITVEAFCLDHHLYASQTFVPYKEVINEAPAAYAVTTTGKKVPIQKALKQGLVSVEGIGDGKGGSGLSLKFKRLNSSVSKLSFEKGTAFGEVPGASIASNSPILFELNTRVSGETSRDWNDRIWRAQAEERMLQELGYYGNKVVNPVNTEGAIRNFQSSAGIPASGLIDKPTLSKLKDESDLSISQLKQVGFEFKNSKTKVIALSEPLREFQTYHGIRSNGIMSAKERELLALDIETTKQVASFYSDSRPLPSIIASPDYPNIITTFRYYDTAYILAKNQDDYELLTFDGTRYRRLGRSESGLVRFKNSFDLAIEDVSTDSLVAYSTTDFDEDTLVRMETTHDSTAATKPKSIFIVTSPLEQGRPIPGLDSFPSATRTARALKAYYGEDLPIFIGQDVQLGIDNSRKLPVLTGPQDIKIFRDGKRINDLGLVSSLSNRLSDLDLNIDLVEAQDVKPGQASVGLVIGTSDESMRSVLLELARQHAFENGVLALAKCGNPDDVIFNSTLISESKARAVIFYDEKIQPQAVKQVLINLFERLRTSGVQQGNWMSLFNQSIDEAAANSSGSDRLEILKLRKAHIQTSDLIPDHMSAEEGNHHG